MVLEEIFWEIFSFPMWLRLLNLLVVPFDCKDNIAILLEGGVITHI